MDDCYVILQFSL